MSVVRVILAMAGAAAMVAGSFLNWSTFSLGGGDGVQAIWLPGRSLYRHAIVDSRNPWSWLTSPGMVMLLLAAVTVLGLVIRRGWLTSLSGALGLTTTVLVAIQIQGANFGSLPGIPETIGVGLWVSAAGSVTTLIAGLLPQRAASPEA